MNPRTITIAPMMKSDFIAAELAETRRIARLVFTVLTVAAMLAGGVMVHRIQEFRAYEAANLPQ